MMSTVEHFDPQGRCRYTIFINIRATVGIGEDPVFNAQECTNKTLTTSPFGNTYEADEVSPEVEVGVVAGLQCLQP
jgi:hypothetical protein